MDKHSRIYIAGHRGLVGSALMRRLMQEDYDSLITRTHKELDLTRQDDVDVFFQKERPEYVFLAAAKVGGILANSTFPADFIYTNLAIQTHIIHAAWKHNVKRLLFLGSSCIYPRDCPQPMKETFLLSGPLESTNEPYALAKIAGIKMCEAYNRQYGTHFIAAMPTNLYGPNDNFDLITSHVLPALIRKFHLAKLALAGQWNQIRQDERIFGPIPEDFMGCLYSLSHLMGFQIPVSDSRSLPDPAVMLWGSGKPRREFLHVDDLADACHFLMQLGDGEYAALQDRNSAPLINIGSGSDLSITEIAGLVKKAVNFDGKIVYDPHRPDGTPQKLLDVSLIGRLGWSPKISFETGIRETYQWYLENR